MSVRGGSNAHLVSDCCGCVRGASSVERCGRDGELTFAMASAHIKKVCYSNAEFTVKSRADEIPPCGFAAW